MYMSLHKKKYFDVLPKGGVKNSFNGGSYILRTEIRLRMVDRKRRRRSYLFFNKLKSSGLYEMCVKVTIYFLCSIILELRFFKTI